MNASKYAKNWVGFLGIAAMALTLGACGKSNDTSTSNVASNQLPPPGGNYYYPNGYAYGTRYNRNGYNLPILQPTDPAGPMAYDTGVRVNAGQTVMISNVWGGWGKVKTHTGSWLGGFIRWGSYSYDCGKNSAGGQNGLWASDGTKAVHIGNGGSFVAQGNGTVLLGINTNFDANFCWSLSFDWIQVNVR